MPADAYDVVQRNVDDGAAHDLAVDRDRALVDQPARFGHRALAQRCDEPGQADRDRIAVAGRRAAQRLDANGSGVFRRVLAALEHALERLLRAVRLVFAVEQRNDAAGKALLRSIGFIEWCSGRVRPP